MANQRGAKGAYNGGNPDSTKGKLPIFHVGRKAPAKDSTAIGITMAGDTVWRNTGARSKGGEFYHPRDAQGKPKGRRYVKRDE